MWWTTPGNTHKVSPRVSVIMPTYNRPDYLQDAINSILNQSMSDFELIIVNDGSSDERALEVLTKLDVLDSRIKIVHQDNHGPAAARNTGCRHASAPIIALMDDDDVSHPDRLRLQSDIMDKNLHIASVSTLMQYMDERGRRMHSSITTRKPYCSPPSPSLETSLEVLDQVVLTATTMIRKEVLEKVGGYRTWFKQIEDVDLTLRVMQEETIMSIPDRPYIQRKHRTPGRVSLDGAPWDYLAAALLSLNSRLSGMPDPIPVIAIHDVHEYLDVLPAPARRYLIWHARGTIRRYIRDGHRHKFKNIYRKVCRLAQDEEDRMILDRLSKRIRWWRLRYFRPWSLD